MLIKHIISMIEQKNAKNVEEMWLLKGNLPIFFILKQEKSYFDVFF